MDSRLPKRTRPHASSGPARARPLPRRSLEARRLERATAPSATPATRPLLRFTRYGIPALAALAGVIAMCFGTTDSLIGGAGLIGAGLSSYLVALLYRLGVSGDSARDVEERARSQFERTGRWPEQ